MSIEALNSKDFPSLGCAGFKIGIGICAVTIAVAAMALGILSHYHALSPSTEFMFRGFAARSLSLIWITGGVGLLLIGSVLICWGKAEWRVAHLINKMIEQFHTSYRDYAYTSQCPKNGFTYSPGRFLPKERIRNLSS